MSRLSAHPHIAREDAAVAELSQGTKGSSEARCRRNNANGTIFPLLDGSKVSRQGQKA